jgi:hypothetical protein
MRWLKKKGKAPDAPSANDLYSGPRAFGDYRPEAASAAAGEIDQLGQMSRTGWNATDRNAFGQMQKQANQAEKSQRGAVMQQAASQGQMNGGMAFAGALGAQQGSANRALDAGVQQANIGADRRMAATQAGAGLKMQQAGATDQFNQWASGIQLEAKKASYEASKAKKDSWWKRVSGGFLWGGFVMSIIDTFKGFFGGKKSDKDKQQAQPNANALAAPAERQAAPTFETEARQAALRDLSGDSGGADATAATREAFAPRQAQASPNEHDRTRDQFRSMFSNTAPRRY